MTHQTMLFPQLLGASRLAPTIKVLVLMPSNLFRLFGTTQIVKVPPDPSSDPVFISLEHRTNFHPLISTTSFVTLPPTTRHLITEVYIILPPPSSAIRYSTRGYSERRALVDIL